MGAATANAVEQHGRQRTEYEAFVDWCFAGTPEDTTPSEDVLRARAKLRRNRRESGDGGYITSIEDIEACVARCVTRCADPEYRRALQEDREAQATLEAAERQRRADRHAEAGRKTQDGQARELREEAQAMRDAGIPVRKIAKATGRSVGWVANHTRKPKP